VRRDPVGAAHVRRAQIGNVATALESAGILAINLLRRTSNRTFRPAEHSNLWFSADDSSRLTLDLNRKATRRMIVEQQDYSAGLGASRLNSYAHMKVIRIESHDARSGTNGLFAMTAEIR
jgi:hypothetical protein